MSKLLIFAIFIFLTLVPNIQAVTINKIIAWVNNDIITEDELDMAMSEIEATGVKSKKEDVLEKLIEERLIMQAAYEKGVEIDSSDVERIMSNIKAKFTSDEEFEQALSSEGVTIDELKEKYRGSLLKKEIVDIEVGSKVSISEKEIEEIKHKFSYQVKVKHILVKNKADAILIQSRMDRGESFDNMVQEYSICPSKANGGVLDFFSPNQMVKEFSDACFNLTKKGEMSGIIETKLGFHIIMLLDKRDTPEEELNQIIEEQKIRMREEKFNNEFSKWIDILKEKAYIKTIKMESLDR